MAEEKLSEARKRLRRRHRYCLQKLREEYRAAYLEWHNARHASRALANTEKAKP